MKISIIVPIYNTENRLQRCVESLLDEETDELDFQIILVNDGSTDHSGLVARYFADKYSDKIEYYEKENGGLSDARNYGVKYAVGDYITFVDSDDYVTHNLYSRLVPYMRENYDMVKIQIAKVNENEQIIDRNTSAYFDNKLGEEAFDILYKNDVMTEVAWGYIYKRDFYINNGFQFAKGLYHEDFGLIPLMLLKAKKVASTTIGTYNYVQTEKSITRGSFNDYVRACDLLKHYDNMIKVIKDYNISELSKDNIKIYFTNCIILEVNNLKGKERKRYIKQIRKRKITRNIKCRNFKQLIKRILLSINIELYLKVR